MINYIGDASGANFDLKFECEADILCQQVNQATKTLHIPYSLFQSANLKFYQPYKFTLKSYAPFINGPWSQNQEEVEVSWIPFSP